MKLSVRDFPEGHPSEAVTVPFSGAVDLSELRFFGGVPFPESVRLTGILRKQHGEVRLEYTASYDLHETCARCLAPMVTPTAFDFAHPVIESHEEQDGSVCEAPNGVLDMQAVAAGDLLFTLNPQPFCGQDCQGLCPWCGQDRNQTPCDCAERYKLSDPRFDALKALLE